MAIRWLHFLLLSALVLAGCGRNEPVRVGFIGGLSGRVADLGIGGRNGAQLAVDARNNAGGIRGQKIELIAEDDKQDPDAAKQVMSKLLDLKVAAIIGPMTSSVATAIVPIANEARLPIVSPTVTTNALSGQDDYFFRVVSSTRSYARISADYHARKGIRRVAVLYDTRNRAYTDSWLIDYRTAFAALGGEVVVATEFASSDDVQFAVLAKQLLETRPDCILILANSVDTAMYLQQIRKLDQKVVVAGPEWAATERLIELAGKSAEGFIAAQFHERQSQRSEYLAFSKAYRERFGSEPGFAGMNGFEATNVLLDALEKKPADQSLKQFLLSKRVFPGVQSEVVFDAYGDVTRPTFVTVVKDGQFMLAK